MLSFTQAAYNFFGRKPGQSVGQFAQELKTLTEADRIEMAPLLTAELGEEVSPEPYLETKKAA